MNDESIRYREVQYFNQMWLRILVILPAAIILSSFVFTLTHDSPIGNMGTVQDDWINWLFVFFITFSLPIIFYSCHLVVEVHPTELLFRFYPFHIRWHSIKWAEMQSAEARIYRPIREYGGWGIRYGRYGKAYNISGNQGVLVTLLNGNTVLFGSQYMNDFEAAIKLAMQDSI